MNKEYEHFQKITNKHEFVMNMNHDGLAIVSPCGTMAMQAGKNCPYIVFEAVGVQREKVEVVKRDIIGKLGIYLFDFDDDVYLTDSKEKLWYFNWDSAIQLYYYNPETPIYEVVRAKTEPGKPVY